MGGQDHHLTVSEVATALGTSPQTVRALLRSGQLRGEQRPWGSRYVWAVDPSGVDEFVAQYGRLDGKRRSRSMAAVDTPGEPAPAPVPEEMEQSVVGTGAPSDREEFAPEKAQNARLERTRTRQWMLRPRGRAAVVLVVLLPTLLALHAGTQLLPSVWWFHEVGQPEVYRRTVEAKIELRLLVGGIAAAFLFLNLVLAGRGSWLEDQRSGVLLTATVACVIGSLFASAGARHWQSYLLWRHPQIVGETDPVHGKDVGYFLFTLPFELVLSGLWLWLVVVAFAVVVTTKLALGDIRLRPLRIATGARLHLALLTSLFLMALARRLYLERYLLELRPSQAQGSSFAGADYVDVHVRMPVLSSLVIAAIVLALLAPVLAMTIHRSRSGRSRRIAVGAGLLTTAAVAFALSLLPGLVERYVVEPNVLTSEAPYLASSAIATQQAWGLDQIDVEQYSTDATVTPAAFRSVNQRLRQVTTWDAVLLQARMRQLVTDTPFYSPQSPDLDVVRVGGRRQTTIVSARELDTGAADVDTHTWGSDRLAYTHGLGLIRFSGTEVGPGREPVLLDSGSGVREPRIYFGDLISSDAAPSSSNPAVLASAAAQGLADSPWVLVDTRRPEVDVSPAHDVPRPVYHYTGPAGIALSNWGRRAILAVAVGSKQVLLSDDVTDRTRMLLHRDVHDRLRTLAPFLHWDSQSFPLTVDGHIVFVVDGYTTSGYFPYAEPADLGGALVNYARPSVRATVDAYTGQVTMYVTDPSDPLIRSWSAIFPSLFTPADQMPTEMQRRGRYPRELFAAQATAYERFHTADPDTLAAESDEWSRPIALSGPLEVAGGVDFDESDEDNLRLTLQPDYSYAAPPGRSGSAARLLLNTYYTPRRGQNLVATLTGWVDRLGRPHLVSKSLPRDPVVLGPAQISRLVFATPRVRNLLGLRNLEIRDLETSSLDSVYLGRPHVLLLPQGLVQTQSLFEGSRGPGAARLLGVTVFVNGRAGLGPDMKSALRQALNSPPTVTLRGPRTATVGDRVLLEFRTSNARREDVVISWGRHRRHERLHVSGGTGRLRWVPPAPGPVHVRIAVQGLDGTMVTDRTSFTVLSRSPMIRLVHIPREVQAGRRVRIVFKVAHGRRVVARVLTEEGIVLRRRYILDDHVGVLEWTPTTSGRAEVLLLARGGQGQTARASLRLHVPSRLRVGQAARFLLSADGCRSVRAEITRAGGDSEVWRWPCPAPRASFDWVPPAPGDYRVVVVAASTGGVEASRSARLHVRDVDAGRSP